MAHSSGVGVLKVVLITPIFTALRSPGGAKNSAVCCGRVEPHPAEDVMTARAKRTQGNSAEEDSTLEPSYSRERAVPHPLHQKWRGETTRIQIEITLDTRQLVASVMRNYLQLASRCPGWCVALADMQKRGSAKSEEYACRSAAEPSRERWAGGGGGGAGGGV